MRVIMGLETDVAEGAAKCATANQRLIGTSFPHHVAAHWASPSRARRIAELIEGAGKLGREEMERIYKLSVPLVVDIGVGKNWLEAKP